jgi:gamma-glutamyl-gamma-aminobutyrate hydrolase PuuD
VFYQLLKNIKHSNTVLIIYARFNIDQMLDGSLSIRVGSTTDVEQITSHAIIIKNGTILYHRSNFIKSIFRGNKFHKKAIKKVLNDAFKKQRKLLPNTE